jgi:O-antigen/teichoic acid export membrane protein
LAILSVIPALRYELAIPLPEKSEDAAAIAVLSLAIIPVTTVAIGLAVWVLRARIISWTNVPALGPYLWLLPVGMALVGVYAVLNYWAVRKKAFTRIARTKLSQGVGAVVTQVALFPLGAIGLLLGQMMGSAAGSLTLVSLAGREDRHAFRAATRNLIARMAIRYRRFPQVSCISGLVDSAGQHVPMLLLASFYGPVVAGQFLLVQRVVGWPTSILGQAVAQVYFGEGAAARHASVTELPRMFLRASKRLAMLALLPMLVLLVAGRWLFPFIFGSGWAPAGYFAQALAPMVAAQFVVSPLSQTLTLLECQTWRLAWDLFRLLLVAASLGFAVCSDWSPLWAVSAYSMAVFFAYLVLWVVLMKAIGRCGGEPDFSGHIH